ncbi:MAG: hypothetical protein AAFR87_18190 [Bacteroidota bacterium]
MMKRRKGHGSVNLIPPIITRAELGWTDGGFGLGYFDGEENNLSHFLWLSGEKEHGPYEVKMLIYRKHDQLKELLALLKSLGDQIQLVSIFEPVEIQVQDLIKQPFKGRMQSRRSPYEQKHVSEAFWQLRICNLVNCISKTHLVGEPLTFNLELDDPIEKKLDDSHSWKGISGKYVIHLGPKSKIEKGTRKNLPHLKSSVGAFSRMWLGVRPASGLAVTDDLEGPADLLLDLDRLIRLPKAQLGWEF